MSKRINLTLPDDVYDVLIADSERNCRSVSEEVTYMIRTHKGVNAISRSAQTVADYSRPTPTPTDYTLTKRREIL